MALNRNNILAGPANVWLNVTVPTSGAPPTLITHTNGVPGSGQQVGFTEGPVEFTYKLGKEEINPEQSYMPVDVFTKDEMAQVTFTAMETTYLTLLRAFDNVGTVSDVNKDLWYFGNGTSIISPFQLSVFFSSAQRRNAGKYVIGMLYSAYSVEGVKLPFTKTKPMTYAVTMKGLADPTRTAADQGGQFYIEK